MGDLGARRGAASLAVPLMLVSFLLIGLFLWWLSRNAESTEVAIEEQPDSAEMAITEGTEVTAEQLRAGADQFAGQLVRISAPVASAVGTQAFFLDLPQAPFLVKLDTTLVARGQALPTGNVTVVGTLRAMNDSIVSDWVGDGVIRPSDQPLVEFATHFIEASRVQARGGASQSP